MRKSLLSDTKSLQQLASSKLPYLVLISFHTTVFIAFLIYRYKQANSETEKYIEKVVALEDKYDLYVEIQQWRKACDVAIKLKDGARLQEVRIFFLFNTTYHVVYLSQCLICYDCLLKRNILISCK